MFYSALECFHCDSMGDNTFNQYKCADSNYGRVEKCEIPGQFCFTSFTDWDGDKGIRFDFDIIVQIKEIIRSFQTEFDKDMKIPAKNDRKLLTRTFRIELVSEPVQ